MSSIGNPASAVTTADRVVQEARQAGTRLVRFLYVDNGGVIRGKSTHVASLARRIHDGIGLPRAMQAVTMLDEVVPVAGMGTTGEVRLVPDPDTFHVLPYAPHTAAMLADLIGIDGAPWGACPRSFLKRQIAACAAVGFSVQAAFEVEFSLAAKSNDGSFTPIHESLCSATTAMCIAASLIDDIIAALEAQNIQVELYHPEVGFGQHELTIHHVPALAAADNQVFYRETIRSVAYNHGLYASLAPKPFPADAGNGAHIHFSLWDNDGCKNELYDANDSCGISKLGYHFIAGVLRHLPALLALTCPSYNSYRRLQPHFWSSAYNIWGPDNREAAIRLPSTFRSDPAGTTNAELKPADSSSDPYLALGGLLAAGLDGVQHELMPDPPILDDPGDYSEEQLAEQHIFRFPTTMKDALDNLEHDPVLMGALGPLLSTPFLAVKRAEWEMFSSKDVDFEIKHHFWTF